MVKRILLGLLALAATVAAVTFAFRFLVPDIIERWYLMTLSGDRTREDEIWLCLIYLLTYLLVLNLTLLSKPSISLSGPPSPDPQGDHSGRLKYFSSGKK
ncbi:hypothetical protein NCG89_07165 [Spongiibacter taiwanensis]|uniref:hypothetical protein n=1 Tax=Spongiibacter taiwanensis TaxID=1748242 RepID=UPI0020361C7F|nr:hypothetical protein [Spongiibacter taiwanensis]USA44548.1 hypothetical protein NCG89_07165 [Spongiibacter taiwanensis]